MPDPNPVTPAAEATPDGGDGAKTFTQEELDRIVGERIGRERQKYSDYDELKTAAERLRELEERDQTEAQKAAKRVEESDARAHAAEARLLRFEVAAAKGLDPKLSEFLTGTDRAEMEAKADQLLELSKPPTPDFDGGVRQGAVQADMNGFIRAGARRATS